MPLDLDAIEVSFGRDFNDVGAEAFAATVEYMNVVRLTALSRRAKALQIALGQVMVTSGNHLGIQNLFDKLTFQYSGFNVRLQPAAQPKHLCHLTLAGDLEDADALPA